VPGVCWAQRWSGVAAARALLPPLSVSVPDTRTHEGHLVRAATASAATLCTHTHARAHAPCAADLEAWQRIAWWEGPDSDGHLWLMIDYRAAVEASRAHGPELVSRVLVSNVSCAWRGGASGAAAAWLRACAPAVGAQGMCCRFPHRRMRRAAP
jgi:hypothetical protein